jgi:hypothetical protein
MTTSTSRLQDGLLALFGLSVIISGMAAIDETARRYIVDAMHGQLPSLPPAFQMHTIARHAGELLPLGDSSFVAFGIAGFVLVIVMFRM